MKIKRKKIGDRSYNLINTETGTAVAHAVQTGEHGRDNYPWEWRMLDGRIFGRLDYITGRSTDSLRDAVDYVESGINSYGTLIPVGEVDAHEVTEGQVFRVMVRNVNYYFRATQDAYGDEYTCIPANNAKGELTEVVVLHGETVTLYADEA